MYPEANTINTINSNQLAQKPKCVHPAIIYQTILSLYYEYFIATQFYPTKAKQQQQQPDIACSSFFISLPSTQNHSTE